MDGERVGSNINLFVLILCPKLLIPFPPTIGPKFFILKVICKSKKYIFVNCIDCPYDLYFVFIA